MPDASVEFLVLPYDSANGNSLVDLLARELTSQAWLSFRAAVAFVRSSGNFPTLVDALEAFAAKGGEIALTFGADLFSSDAPASDFAAVEALVRALEPFPLATVHLYHEPYRTFHPKLYVFANEVTGHALVLVGSSNWSAGGLLNNVEANVIVRLDFAQTGHRQLYDEVLHYFTAYWSET
jgi:HKD family nuclease